jgi:hypothetical protein
MGIFETPKDLRLNPCQRVNRNRRGLFFWDKASLFSDSSMEAYETTDKRFFATIERP